MKRYDELVLKQFKVNKNRNRFIVIGIILGIILLTATLYLNTFMGKVEIARNEIQNGNFAATVRNLSEEEKRNLTGNVKVREYGFFTEYDDLVLQGKTYNLNGLSKEIFDIILNKNFFIESGRIPLNDEEVIINNNIRDELKKDVGDKITVEEKTYTIVGIYNGTSNVYTNHLEILTTLPKNQENIEVNIVFNLYDNRNMYKELKNIIFDSTGIRDLENERIYTNWAYIEVLDRVTLSNLQALDESDVGVLAMNLCIIVLTIFLIYGAINSSLRDKIKMFSILKCIGCSNDKIKWLLIKESLILVLVSLIPGLILGTLLAILVIKGVLQGLMAMDLYNVAIKLYLNDIIFIVILVSITVFISSIIPAKKISKLELIEGVNGRVIHREKVKSSKWIRRLLGYKFEIAYKNVKSNYNTFIVSVALNTILVIIFTGFISYLIYNLEISYESTKVNNRDINIDYSGSYTYSEDDFNEVINKEINRINYTKNELSKYNFIGDLTTTLNINVRNTVNNAYSNGANNFIHSTRLLVYDDVSFNEIKDEIQGEKVSLTNFKENGCIIVNKIYNNVLQRKEVNPLDISDEEKVNVKLNRENESQEIIQLNPIGTISPFSVKETQLSINDNYLYLIISFDTLVENLKKMNSDFITYSIFLGYDILNKDEYSKYENIIEETVKNEGGWLINYYEQHMEFSSEIMGFIIIGGVILLLTMGMSVISSLNSKNINFSYRKNEIGTLLAIGMKKKDINKVLFYERVIEHLISILIGGGISLFILKIIYLVAYNFSLINTKTPPFGIILLLLMVIYLPIVIGSVVSLNKFKQMDVIQMIRDKD
ncbi:MAG: FtsX-like permease family protein [Clostridium sp.]